MTDADLIPVDLTNIPESQLVPEGSRVLKVQKIEVQKSSTGNPMLLWTFDDVNDENIRYMPIWVNTSLLPQALYRLRDLTFALQVFPTAEGFRKSECVGKICRGWVTHEEYQEKKVAKADDFAPIS
jgi:hypothetical protein